MSEKNGETHTAYVEHTQRYVRRTEGPGLAFIPYGLIPAAGLALLALFAFFPFASHWIEDNVEQSALNTLRAQGEGWVDVSASGQWITLTGQAPNAERAAKAVQLVQSARAPTIFGQARPVTRVTDKTTIVAGIRPEASSEPAATEPETLPDTEVEAAPEEQERARVAACDQSLRDLLLDSKIEFATGSARIAPESAGLLNKLARQVKGCDLHVAIEGHTDSTGSGALNERLSLARAQAVRDALAIRGVSPDLLSAEGYGAARPVAGNDTPEGREQNRRIEFNVRSGDEAQD